MTGAHAMVLEKTIKRICRTRELPDFPNLDPMPSIADLPMIFSSSESGINVISLVLSKTVYLAERTKIFCKEPKNTDKIKGETPKTVMTNEEFFKKIKEKNPTPVTVTIMGVRRAVAFQPNFLMNDPETR